MKGILTCYKEKPEDTMPSETSQAQDSDSTAPKALRSYSGGERRLPGARGRGGRELLFNAHGVSEEDKNILG